MITIAGWHARYDDLPRFDRDVLLMDALGRSRAFVLAHPEHPIEPALETGLAHAAQRLRGGEPVAYVRGWKEFHGLEFRVTPDVLVPRPETELLVDLCLAHAQHAERVLDLGTGSGAIAIAIAHGNPGLRVTAADRSRPALAVARCNVMRLAPHVDLVLGDWFRPFGVPFGAPFDIVVANPPYIAADDAALASLRTEPVSALVSGEEGLDDLRSIIEASPAYCRRLLLLEHGASQGEAVRALMRDAGYVRVRTEPDLAGLERVTLGERP